MSLPLKSLCKRKKVCRDGTSLIFIQYCYSSKRRTNLNTDISIHTHYWDPKKCCVSDNLILEQGNATELNEELIIHNRLAEDLVKLATMRNVVDKAAFVRKTFNPGFDIRTLEIE